MRTGQTLNHEASNKPQGANRGNRYRYLVFVTGLAFIVYLFWQSRHIIYQRIPTINGWLFILATIIGFVTSLATCLYFYKLLHKYHQDIGLKLTIDMFFFGQLAKYIPGKIWSIVFQGLLSRGQIHSSSIILSNIDLTVLQINVTIVVGLGIILALNHSYWLVALAIIGGLGACHYISTSCFSERCVIYISRWITRLAKYKIACEPRFSWFQSASFFLLVAAAFTASHVFLLIAVFGLSLNEGLFYTGLIALSWVVGMITMISPAGMGIRELVFIIFAKLTMQHVDDATLSAIATIARLWLIFLDILSAGMLYLYNKLLMNHLNRP